MLDFVFFFLVFLPVMDGIRQLRGFGSVPKLLVTGVVTTLIGSYFVYTSILAGKSYCLLVLPSDLACRCRCRKAQELL